jgi:hypothetical protein
VSEPPPLPAWIDPTQELVDTTDRDVTPEAFVRDSLAHLEALGVPRERAFEVVAHCATECRWGERALGDNCGGVKLKQDDDRAHRKASGRGLAWWRWAGHIKSGDALWVYYRAFDDRASFWRFWLARYVPRPGWPADRARYVETGRAFWGTGDWFTELLRAGYRGPIRRAEVLAILERGSDPAEHPSVKAHRKVVARVKSIAT